jgi:hypothetical protein
MAGNLHAIALIAIPLITVAACVRFRQRALRQGRVLGAIFGGSVLSLLAGILSSHACSAGQPLTQWLIPGVCFAATVALVRRAAVRDPWALALLTLMFLLSFHYSHIVHGPTYVGSPDFGRVLEARAAAELQQAAQVLQKLGAKDDAAYPQGWLREAAFVSSHPTEFEGVAFEWAEVRVAPLWHSILTRLYLRNTTVVAMWYPGGRLRDAAGKLRYRDKGGDGATPIFCIVGYAPDSSSDQDIGSLFSEEEAHPTKAYFVSCRPRILSLKKATSRKP